MEDFLAPSQVLISCSRLLARRSTNARLWKGMHAYARRYALDIAIEDWLHAPKILDYLFAFRSRATLNILSSICCSAATV